MVKVNVMTAPKVHRIPNFLSFLSYYNHIMDVFTIKTAYANFYRESNKSRFE